MTESKVELERRIHALETQLAELKDHLKELEAIEQHEAIDHLDDRLRDIDHKCDDLRSFWPEVLKELRTLLHK